MGRVPPIIFTRMFEPRHNILSNVPADIRQYVVSWLKHSRESNRPVLGPKMLSIISLWYSCAEERHTACTQPVRMQVTRGFRSTANVRILSPWMNPRRSIWLQWMILLYSSRKMKENFYYVKTIDCKQLLESDFRGRKVIIAAKVTWISGYGAALCTTMLTVHCL